MHQSHLLLHSKSLLWVLKGISVQAMLQMTRMQTESWIKACLGFQVNDELTKNKDHNNDKKLIIIFSSLVIVLTTFKR